MSSWVQKDVSWAAPSRRESGATRGVGVRDFFTDNTQAFAHNGLGHGVIDPQALVTVSPFGIAVAEEEVERQQQPR